MKVLKLAVIIILLMLLGACQPPTDEEIYYRAQKKLGEMESYQTTAKIFVHRDDGEQEYVFQQTFNYPNKYRLEVISPESLKGNLTISNGKTAWMKHPSINQVWRMEQFQQSQEQLMFIGYFMENLYNSSESTIQRYRVDGSDFIIITTILPGSNYYFHQQILWIDSEAMVPTQLDIIDEKGNLRFRVTYEDFIYNPKLEEGLFNLK